LLILEKKGIKEKEKTSFFCNGKKYLEEKSFSLKKKENRHFSSYLLIIRAQCGILPKHFSQKISYVVKN